MANIRDYFKVNISTHIIAFVLGVFASLASIYICNVYISLNPIAIFPNKLFIDRIEGYKSHTVFTVYNKSDFTCYQIMLNLHAKDYDVHSLDIKCPKSWLTLDSGYNDYLIRLEILNPHETAIFNVSETITVTLEQGSEFSLKVLEYSKEPPSSLIYNIEEDTSEAIPDENPPKKTPTSPGIKPNTTYNKYNIPVHD